MQKIQKTNKQKTSLHLLCSHLPLYAKDKHSEKIETWQSSTAANCEGYVEKVWWCSLFTRGMKAPF